MIRFLVTGDWHLRGTNPRNRIDDYVAAAKAKLREVMYLAWERDARAIIMPGDLWDRPEVTTGVLLDYVYVLKESHVPIIVTSGNHDIYGYNIETLERTSLNLAAMLVPQMDVNKTKFISDSGLSTVISCQPYTGKVDIDGWGYSFDYPPYVEDHFKIHVVHGMLLDHEPPFDKYTLLSEVKTNADIVITGHDHTGYGIYRRADDVTFINPGALLRSAASVSEMERPIQVALIEIRGKGDYDVKLLPITCAKPGNEVLDRSKIEADQKRAYAMESFAALIQAETGEKVLLNIDSIVEQIAASEKYDAAVVQKALERIAAERANV